jgi:hypothetical protein
MSQSSVRDEVLGTLQRNFFGPAGGPTESFEAAGRETPVTRYMTGILYPSDSVLPPDQDDGGLDTDSAQSPREDEARLSMCNAPSPSSYGMSFACKAETPSLRINITCGLYKAERNSAGRIEKWTRAPFAKEEIVTVARNRKVEKRLLAPGLELRVTFRAPDRFGDFPITATLVNTHSPKGVKWEDQAALCFFQCGLSVSGTEGSPFTERRSRDTSQLERELRHALLLYRHARLFAVGHGCAATWNPDSETQVPDTVSISFIPVHDVYPLVPPDDLGVPDLPLARLASEDLKTTSDRYLKLVEAYEAWIGRKAVLAGSTPAEFSSIAAEQVAACRESAARIRKGIGALSDPVVFEAFRLAQRTMLEVFARSRWQKDGFRPEKPPTFGDEHKWRPFQAAFFLQAFESLSNPKSSDRDVCDLLWFPTGGGKTEAYLALTAAAFFLRRLRAGKGSGGGTSVLMRYTLRLLTADQFVRACLMTCAAEVIRRSEPKLQKTAPISIGLWVGDGTTPNTLKAAAEALGNLHAGRRLSGDQSSPVKLKRCPWCGTPLGIADYRMAPGNTAVRLQCSKAACDFRGGIPAVVVDQQLYEERPSLVIGTVDKFARLPWEPRAGAIFSTDGRFPAPDLVIQDELHLISGPLGTVAGLYEAAIDRLCTRDGIPPKLVASTATIRNAGSQVRRLFNRRFAQFPQPLLDARDSFFARQSETSDARRFVGLFTPGKTPLTAFIRMTGTLGHASFASAAADADKDPYWTTIAYFNSLRELGGAIARVHDDVAEYMKTCASLAGIWPLHRTLDAVEELTSRANEEKLDEVRERLWEKKGVGDPFDMVLCSNMISVGLDVPRLGLMAVVGQPKTTAEYIQASSRIGRASPGLVVTLYNWTRSRDRSHYERFIPYHSRLYAEVEATSVTPYSSRARDRALHAVFVSLVRHLVPGMLDNDAAGRFRAADPAAAAIAGELKARIAAIEKDPADVAAAQAHVDRIAGNWETQATASRGNLEYQGDPDSSLLVHFDNYNPSNPGFATMNNMRNVDAPAGVYLV